jgi:hypothetical protein
MSVKGITRTEGAGCVVAPRVTEGPYWVDEGLKRSDLRGGQTRAP